MRTLTRSLTFKLTLAFLVVSLTGIVLIALLVWGITSSEFNQVVAARGLSEFTTAVTNYYKAHNSWDGVTEALQKQGLIQQNPVVANPLPEPAQNAIATDTGNHNPFRRSNEFFANPPPNPFVLVDQNSKVIVPFGPFHQGEVLPENRYLKKNAIRVNNQIVGYVVSTGRNPNPSPTEARFIARTTQALLLAALVAGITAILLGLLLARTITRPVRDLTQAARELAAGRLNRQVPVRSKDELGELTSTFNQMSADLERSNHLRKQMTADIAHDLRTPLAVITGYLEGLKDGILRPTPQRFTAMYDEALYLQRLVEDLRTLSLADAGELSMNYQPVQPGDVVERLAASFQNQAEQKGVQLETHVEDNLPAVRVDPERIQQALCNLVSNALRYTPQGGSISINARSVDGGVQVTVADTGTGIDPESLPHVFERFYRGDNARQDDGSGLGLAIAKSIVELQGGKISADSAGKDKGSQFSILIPV